MAKEVAYPEELIGKTILVVSSPNQTLMGVEGEVVDETRSTLVVLCDGEKKTLLKKVIIFVIKGRTGKIDGSTIMRRSEDRLKGK